MGAANPLTWREVLEGERGKRHVLLAIRHGETTYNVEKRFATTTDVPLTEQGRSDAAAAAASLAGVRIDAVYSSPMSRARDTAELILPGSSERLVVDDRLARASGRTLRGGGAR